MLHVGAVDGVQGAPEGVEGLVGGGKDFFFLTLRMLFEPTSPCGAVSLVSFLVHREISEAFR